MRRREVVVERERHHRVAARARARERHVGDVDAGVAEQRADAADHAGHVVVAQEQQAPGELDLEREAVHAHEPGVVIGAEHRADDRALLRVAHRHGEQVRVVGGARAVLLGHLDAELGRDRERVDVVQALVRRAERAAQRGRGEQARAGAREAPRRGDLDARDGPLRERHREPAEALGDRQERLQHAALVLGHERQVERVRDRGPRERGHDLLGDDDAGAILRLARRAREVRREHAGWARRAAASRPAAAPARRRRAPRPPSCPERSAATSAASSTSAPRAALTSSAPGRSSASRVASISPRVVSRHRQVEADDVGGRERGLDRRGAARRRARPCARRSRTGRRRRCACRAPGPATATSRPMRPKPSSASVLSASSMPAKRSRSQRAVAQRALGGADVARQRQQQRERVLGGGDDVRLGRVADDDARRRRGVDVDVVDADARAADHAQPGRRRDQRRRRRAWPSARRAPRRRRARPRRSAPGPSSTTSQASRSSARPESAIGSATTQRGMLIAGARPGARRGRR